MTFYIKTKNILHLIYIFSAWNVITMILLGFAMLFCILAFVFAAIYSFYTRRSKYPLITNCSLIGIAGIEIFVFDFVFYSIYCQTN